MIKKKLVYRDYTVRICDAGRVISSHVVNSAGYENAIEDALSMVDPDSDYDEIRVVSSYRITQEQMEREREYANKR